MGFDESTILRASKIDRTAPKITETAAKAAFIWHDIVAEILDADSQWLLPPPPVSSNVATKKIRRSENYDFSSASAPNLPTARNHVEVALHESGADALQRLIQCHVGLSDSIRTSENFAVIKNQSNKILTSSGEHFVSRERTSSQIVLVGLMVVSYVIIACGRCYCYHLPSGI